MDTSKSNKNIDEWIGSALIFSGRPDPIWSVDKKTSKRLEEIWNSLENWIGKLPTPPILGYRGCILKAVKSNREWFAYGGNVTLKEANLSISRIDRECQFEKVLLASAPESIIPKSFIENVK